MAGAADTFTTQCCRTNFRYKSGRCIYKDIAPHDSTFTCLLSVLPDERTRAFSSICARQQRPPEGGGLNARVRCTQDEKDVERRIDGAAPSCLWVGNNGQMSAGQQVNAAHTHTPVLVVSLCASRPPSAVFCACLSVRPVYASVGPNTLIFFFRIHLLITVDIKQQSYIVITRRAWTTK